MAKGTSIVVSSNPQGKFLRGYVNGTPKPGTNMEIDPGVAPVNGLYTYRVYQPGTDGERRPIQILCEDDVQGRVETAAFVSGDAIKMYVPANGEELNILKLDVAGTGDDFVIGDMLICDTGTGKFLKTTGSPESEPFQCLETVTDPTADQLVHARYTGY